MEKDRLSLFTRIETIVTSLSCENLAYKYHLHFSEFSSHHHPQHRLALQTELHLSHINI